MVTLVGAGPGDSGLITVKGAKRLQEADVVLYDRLVGRDVIAMIPDSAEKIDVGKNAGDHPMPQHEINALLLSKAQKGLNVVRLKGGDPFVFGRGGEELEYLAENGAEFEVVPGISSSIAGGAYGGIPVTHRDFTSSLHIITGHAKANGSLDIDYGALVSLNGTLVFMMGVSAIGDICQNLMSAGMEASMPAAVIENATLPSQRKFVGTVETIYTLARDNKVNSPAVIIVGKVCSLSDTLDWFSSKPLFGKKVMVTRARAGESVLADMLRQLGCDVIGLPCTRIIPIANPQLDVVMGDIKSYSWIVFTSGTGVELFFDYMLNTRIDIRTLSHLKIAAVGSETQKKIEKMGIFVDFVPELFSGLSLAQGLLPILNKHDKILIPRAKAGSEDMLNVFANDIEYTDLPLYDTVFECGEHSATKAMLISREIDAVAFTSSLAVEGFVKIFPDIDFSSVNGVCIGEMTAKTAVKYGFNIKISKETTIHSMVDCIREMLNGY